MRGTPKSSILGNHISDHGGLDDDKLKWIVECYGGSSTSKLAIE